MMTPWGDAEWSRVVVYGLGLSGRAAAGFLRSRGVEVVGVDRRGREALDLGELGSDPGLELVLGDEPRALPAGVDGVVLSPGVPPDRPLLADARRQGVPVIAEVELAFPFLNGPAVGVTGSNGKSTTTALAGAALAASGVTAEVCGNIGVPLTACVDGEPGRVFVVELSSFQLESVDTFRPRAAALLNLTADHLDRHTDLAAYRAAKEAIFARQESEDVAVLNADDPYVAAIGARARRRFFSRLRPVEDGCYLDGGRVVEAEPGLSPVELFRPEDLRVHGLHNLENAMAAALLARALGADSSAVRTGLASFSGLPHRLEQVRSLGGVSWFNDSKGTNIDATLRSLEGFEGNSVHLILGGRHKGGDPAVLADAVGAKARRVYLIGEAAEEFERVLSPVAASEQCGDLERAVSAAHERARSGEVVLLSPACASFDQYNNFAERGEHFNRLVARLPEVADG
jgi:UDP-N-acetylmuramoylalanine--D-glutamate ligase